MMCLLSGSQLQDFPASGRVYSVPLETVWKLPSTDLMPQRPTKIAPWT